MSARILRPDIRIVCRCIDERIEAKVHKAGADAVVSPNRIGGLRMIAEMVRSAAADYLELMLRDQEQGLRVESAAVQPGSVAADLAVGELRRRIEGTFLVLAVQRADGTWLHAPEGDVRLAEGQQLICVVGPDSRTVVERLTAA